MRTLRLSRVVAATATVTATAALAATAASAPADAASPTTPTPTVTERPLSPGANPAGITGTPDGGAWFTLRGTPGGLGRLTPAGDIFEHQGGVFGGLTADAAPSGISPGPDGTTWFVEQAGVGGVGYVDATGTAVTEFRGGQVPGFSANAEPTDIALGADGNLWVTLRAGAAIVQVTPAGAFTEFALEAGSRPEAIVAGPDGALWFTDSGATDRIGRIALDGTVSHRAVLPADSQPADIAEHAGDLWVTLAADPGGIARIKPGVDARVYTPSNSELRADSRPGGIAGAADGHVWFTQAADPGGVARITRRGDIDQFIGGVHPGLSAGIAPEAIAAHVDGSLWFTAPSGARLGRVTVGPAVGRSSAHPVSHDAAVLQAQIKPNGQATSYHFEYGLTTEYGSSTPASSAGPTGSGVAGAQRVDGLRPESIYHYRVVASNATDTVHGPSETFATGTPPSSPEGPTAEEDGTAKDQPSPRPALGRKVVVGETSGRVRVRHPGATRYSELHESSALPVGTRIDASDGHIRLTTALPDGKRQAGEFWGGEFRVGQTRSGMTELALVGRLSCRPTADAAIAAARPARRKLWGKDRSGRFRTRGANSTATVRGTKWLVEDTCGRTVTRVAHGAVVVRDLVRGKSVLVKAGKRYVARAKR